MPAAVRTDGYETSKARDAPKSQVHRDAIRLPRLRGKRADGDEIGVCDRTDISHAKGDKSGCTSRCCDEFDLEPIRRIDRDHSAEIASAQMVVGKITDQDHCF